MCTYGLLAGIMDLKVPDTTIFDLKVQEITNAFETRVKIFQPLFTNPIQLVKQLSERTDDVEEIEVRMGPKQYHLHEWRDLRHIKYRHSFKIITEDDSYHVINDLVYRIHTIYLNTPAINTLEIVKKHINEWKLVVNGDWIEGHSFQSSLCGFEFTISDVLEVKVTPEEHWKSLDGELQSRYPFVANERMVIELGSRMTAVYNEGKVYTSFNMMATLANYPNPKKYIELVYYFLNPYRTLPKGVPKLDVSYVVIPKKPKLFDDVSVKIIDNQIIIKRPILCSPNDYLVFLQNQTVASCVPIFVNCGKKNWKWYKEWYDVRVPPDMFYKGFEIEVGLLTYTFTATTVHELYTFSMNADHAENMLASVARLWHVFILFEYAKGFVSVELRGLHLEIHDLKSSKVIELLKYPTTETLLKHISENFPLYTEDSLIKMKAGYQYVFEIPKSKLI